MDRRAFTTIVTATVAAAWAAIPQAASAMSLADLSNGDVTQGLKAALEKGAAIAVAELGKSDGFLGNDKVKIQLPGYLKDAAQMLRLTGQGPKLDELVTAMNRAAEAAVPQAREMLVSAAKSMTVDDARKILTGGETSVTEFFAHKTREPLGVKFLPIVTKATEKVGLAEKYNQIAGKLSGLGLVKPQDANIQQYVTGKSLDGLYLMIAEEEKKIRRDPIGTGSAILQKVFGAVR